MWTILMTPGKKAMNPGRFIMEINVVQNDISDNFYFDYKAVFFYNILELLGENKK